MPKPKDIESFMLEPTFSLVETAAVLGLERKTLWAQISRGMVQIGASRFGPGVEIQLSGLDVIRLAALQELGKLGGSMKISAHAASLIEQRAHDVLSEVTRPDFAVLHRNSAGEWDMKIGRLAFKRQPYAVAVLHLDDLTRNKFEELKRVIGDR